MASRSETGSLSQEHPTQSKPIRLGRIYRSLKTESASVNKLPKRGVGDALGAMFNTGEFDEPSTYDSKAPTPASPKQGLIARFRDKTTQGK